PVVPGKTVELLCIVGDDVCPIGRDVWGNPSFLPADGTIRQEGNVWMVTCPSLNLVARSNPIPRREGKYKQYWGDLHAQSDATVGTGSEEEYFRFARDNAQLDFCSHQGNDFQVTDEDWRRLNEQVRAFHRDGEFV